jgi:hypothetical protein
VEVATNCEEKIRVDIKIQHSRIPSTKIYL